MSLRISAKLLLLTASGGLVFAAAQFVGNEMQSSRLQAHYLSVLGSELTYKVESGPSNAVRFPTFGPYDERLGYNRIPGFTRRLEDHGMVVAAQARMSPRLMQLTNFGLYPAYREKDQAGLEVFDCNARSIYSVRLPARIYDHFSDIPVLVVQSLLFIEDRELLDASHPARNPAIAWGRFGRALLDQVVHLVNPSHETPGGSTLITQIEKFRHSPGGETVSRVEKLRQMASASVWAYLNGVDTLPARKRIVVDYLNTVPLSAKAGYGEIEGLGDGLWAWYGRDFSRVNALLREPLGAASQPGGRLAQQAQAYKEALSLMLAQRGPSHYLGRNVADLEQLTDSYLRLLENAGVIPDSLRDAALKIPLRLRSRAVARPSVPFVARKAVTAVRIHLSALLGVAGLYDLDRLDLSASTTIDNAVQQAVTAELGKVGTPQGARAAGLYGHNMLRLGDNPGRLLFSFALFERHGNANLLRVQTDSAEQPFDINLGARLNLGSTAKLRTLVNYLQIITALHQRYAGMAPDDLARVRAGAHDALSRWAIAYLATAPDKGLPAMLEAAMDRRYSASPAEVFFTGGGQQTFSNFEPEDNGKVLTVREAFQRSVNLVFVRLMRDIVHYYMFQVAGSTARLLANPAARHEYLSRFADREGSVFIERFYKKYRGKTPQEMEDILLQGVRPAPSKLATVFRSIEPQAGENRFDVFMRQRLPAGNLSDQALHDLYEKYGADKFSLADRGYIAGVHPLELWLVEFMRAAPQATLAQTLAASHQARQDVYVWLFKTHNANAQDRRIKSMMELEAFLEIGRAWRALGYPFASLTPSYASAIGASGDRPAALADLMGIIVSGGLRLPTQTLASLDFAAATPYETRFVHAPSTLVRVLPQEIAAVVRRALLSVVDGGTGERLKGGYVRADGRVIDVGGKTGTGDQRYEVFARGGRLIASRKVNRSATFVFLIGDRFFGAITAYVHEPYAAQYTFTSAMTVQLLRALAPELSPLTDPRGRRHGVACR